jgi:ribonuclease D
MRVDTFYPIAGLLQVGDGVRAYLIDPLTIDNWQPLAALLENPAVVKVLSMPAAKTSKSCCA